MAQCFNPKDNSPNGYNELWDCIAGSTVLKGDAVVRQDVFGFWLKSYERAGEVIAVVYKMHQVEARKRTGTGEAFLAGDKVYYYPGTDDVSPNATGVLGVDYYKCGTAKKNAAASATTVLIEFDGYDYNVA